MDLSLFNDLPEPLKSILIGAAGDFWGGLGADIAGRLLDAGGYALKKLFRPGPKQEALNRAMARALAETVADLSDDPVEMEHLLGLLDEWTQNSDVAGELSQIIDPRKDTKFDVKMLVGAFEALGYDPDTFHETLAFDDIIANLVDAFSNAAEEEAELQGVIKIGLLREIARRTEQQVREDKKQTALMEEMVETGKRAAPELDMTDLERAYLRGLYAECNDLPLADTPPDAGGRQPRMQKVYVDLKTSADAPMLVIMQRLEIAETDRPRVMQLLKSAFHDSEGFVREMQPDELMALPFASDKQPSVRGKPFFRSENAERFAKQLGIEKDDFVRALNRLSAFEAIRQHKQLVLLGDPGSGKSTLTRRLAGVMAAALRDDLPTVERDWQAQIGEVSNHWLLPVRITLSSWASTLPEGRKATARDLINACLSQIEESGSAPNDRLRDRFMARLKPPDATVLILLDGLDEVTDSGQRQRLLAAISDFHDCYEHVPLVVTCRVRPYRNDNNSVEDHHFLLPLPDVELAKLDDTAIETFSQRWHDELAWAGLYDQETAANAHRRLLNAVRDPNRDELGDMAGTPLLLTLMARVNNAKGLPDERAVLYKEFVEQMLYEWERLKLDDQGKPTSLELLLQQEGVDPSSFDRALSQLAYKLHDQSVGRDTVDIPRSDMEDAMRAIHGGDEVTKAAWAVKVLQLMDARTGLIRAMEQGKVYQFTHRTFQEYLAATWLASGKYRTKFNQRLDDENWREAMFLALGYQISVQKEYDNALWVLQRLPDNPASERDWRRVLLLGEAYVRLLGPQKASEAEGKEEAAEVVEKAPRLLTQAMQNPSLPANQRLEAGLLLARLDIDPPGLDDFIPPLDKENARGFHIARYPVTNKQFCRFIDAGGYEANQPWWPEDIVRHLNSWFGNILWHKGPRYWNDERFNLNTQPIVGVSWYEANAYCQWLTEELRSNGSIDQHHEVRLPTEAQWMQTADDYISSWGNDFDPTFANTKESSLGRTTPVNMYPGGKTPGGVWDLIGNVWEWSADADRHGRSMLKGSSFHHFANTIDSTSRGWQTPNRRKQNLGFRVVVVPVST